MPFVVPIGTTSILPAGPIATPHLAYPVQITNDGFAQVDQNSIQEITGNVAAIAQCSIGACPELPSFGIPDPTFQPAPPDASALIAAIQALEPRATETAVVSALSAPGGWQMVLDTTIANTGS